MSTTSRAIAVFASGNGSNLQAIIDAVAQKKLNAHIAVVVSDTEGAYALTRATTHQIPTILIPAQAGEKKEAYATRLVVTLKPYAVTLICLAGFMRLLGKPLLDAYPNRIINIHPSLLPAYPGLHVIERAFADHVSETGCTIHYVDAGMDTGPTIAQTRVAIRDEDTLETLTERIHNTEHALYPATIQKVLDQITAS